MAVGNILFLLGLLIFIIILVALIRKDAVESKLWGSEILAAQQAYDKAEKSKDAVYKKLMASIVKCYGEETARDVRYRKIWIGMPNILLVISRGKAESIKESKYRGTTREKWYYRGYITRLGTYKYRFEVTLENCRVIGWKDLD